MNIAFSMDKQQLEGDPLMELYRQIGEGLKTQPGVKDVRLSVSSCQILAVEDGMTT